MMVCALDAGWLPLPAAGAPSCRGNFGATIAGQRLLVFGGEERGQECCTGARFQVAF